MRKISFLMAFLIAGYILGIWNFLVLPKYYINFGLKGFIVSLVPTLVAMFLIYSEAESTKKTRYLIYELFFKISRTPALIFSLLMFLLVILGVTTYYSSYGLALILGVGSKYIPILAAGTVALSILMLLLAKGRTLEFISIFSILFILFALVAALLIRNGALATVVSPQAVQYMENAVSSITSFNMPLTAKGVIYMLVSVLISFGLGTGVYYVIGSFAPEELDLRKVLAGVFVLQIILSFAAAFTVAYSLGAAYQAVEEAFQNPDISAGESLELFTRFDDLKQYTTNSDASPVDSIEVFYSIPTVLKGNLSNDTTLITLLMLSLYLAGLTSIIVLIEMGSHILSEVMQLSRNGSLGLVGFIGMMLAAAMVVGDIRTMFVVVPFSVATIMAAIESYPLIPSELAPNKGAVLAIVLVLLLSGLVTIYYALTASAVQVKMGAVLGLVLLVPLLMNKVLLKSRR